MQITCLNLSEFQGGEPALSGVVNEGEGDPGIMIVLVGTLDVETVFKPTFEVMCESAQPWVQAGSERRRFPGMPT